MKNKLINELQNRNFEFTRRFTLEDATKQHNGALREKVTIEYNGIEINFMVSYCVMLGVSIHINTEAVFNMSPAQIHINYNNIYGIEFNPSSITVVSDTARNHMKNWQAVNLAVAELCEALLWIDEIDGFRDAIEANYLIATEHYRMQKYTPSPAF